MEQSIPLRLAAPLSFAPFLLHAPTVFQVSIPLHLLRGTYETHDVLELGLIELAQERATLLKDEIGLVSFLEESNLLFLLLFFSLLLFLALVLTLLYIIDPR